MASSIKKIVDEESYALATQMIYNGKMRLAMLTGGFKARRPMVELYTTPHTKAVFVLRWVEGTSVELYFITGRQKALTEYSKFVKRILVDTFEKL